MIQTSFFPEKEDPSLNHSFLAPVKIEIIIPEREIKPDTYLIYPTGGFHHFYGTPTPGHPRYQQAIWPHVKRVKYEMQKWQTKHRQVKVFMDKDYAFVSLLSTRLGKRLNRKKEENRLLKLTFHRLVALAFIPNPENKPLVMHKNDDTTNYLIENLKWGTPSENMKGKISSRPDTLQQKYLHYLNRGIAKG